MAVAFKINEYFDDLSMSLSGHKQPKKSNSDEQVVETETQAQTQTQLTPSQEPRKTDVKSELAMKTLEFQISYKNRMRKESQEKRSTPVKQYNSVVYVDNDGADKYLSNDMQNVLDTKKWKNLAACFQWKFITNYLDANNADQKTIAYFKSQFSKKALGDIEYDIKENAVVKLNREYNGKCW